MPKATTMSALRYNLGPPISPKPQKQRIPLDLLTLEKIIKIFVEVELSK